MIIHLKKKDIREVSTESLILPVDGSLCKFGAAAGTALKLALPAEERKEIIDELEERLLDLKPIPNGEAKMINLADMGIACPWRYLVILAVLPHHVNDRICHQSEFSRCLTKGIISGLKICAANNIKSVACTIIADSYRLSSNEAIRSMILGFKSSRKDSIDIFWCFIGQDKLDTAKQECQRAGLLVHS